MADSHRCRRNVRRREHRRDHCDRRRRPRAGLAGRPPAPQPAGAPERRRQPRRRLAGAAMTLPLAASPSVWWYATRAAGTMALVLLTASVVLGVIDWGRWQSERWPRFVVDGIHRTVSLVAVSMVAVHVLTTLLDSFTSIGLRDAFIPFASSYRPLWLGLGALAFDLLLAVTATSVLRRRVGHRVWRGVHWAAYACWPLALLHSLGTGTDTPVPWMLLLSLACVIAVLAAAGWRAAATWPQERRARSLAGATQGSLEVQIEGQPVEGDGVAMSTSRVALGPRSEPRAYRGELTSLSGSRLLARVCDGSRSLALRLNLAIDEATGRVHGFANAQPAPGRR